MIFNKISVSVKIFSLATSLVFLSLNTFSQYYVKSKVDSTTFVIDSVILAIDDLNGTIDWEVSSDTLTWKSLQLDNDSLWIRIDSSAYYRAMLSVGTCFPVSSGIAKVGFKSIIVPGNSITLDPEGGVYIFSSGMKVIVPPGAVTEPMTITLNLLDSIGADLYIPFDADTGKVFCAGIYCEPSLPQLLKPIRIRLPAKNYTFADLPVVFQYDPVYGTWERYAGDFTCSESMQFIEYSTDYILSSRMVLIKDVFVYGKSSERSKLKGIDCRAILAKLETSAYVRLGQLASGECHVADDRLSVTFTACPGTPVETAHLREIGKSCKPSAVHDVKKCLAKGEQTAMSITVTVGGFPLEKQRIVVGLPSGLSAPGLPLPLTFMTDEDGNVTFIISCDVDKFAGTIIYNVYYDYPLTVIAASADGASEVHRRDIVSGNISNSVRIECPYLDHILLISSCGPMKINETCQLYPTCLDQFGNPIDCGDVEFIVTESLPSAGVISIGSDGMLTCLTPGLAYIKAQNGVIESNSIGISVAYQGDMQIDVVRDYSSQEWFPVKCGCPEGHENDPEFAFYKMTFNAELHINFWLNNSSDYQPNSELSGNATTTYEIVSDICQDMTFYDNPITCSLIEILLNPDIGRVPTTADILNGIQFEIEFSYFNFRGHIADIRFGGQLSGNIIELHQVGSYVPEACVGYIYDNVCTLK